MYDYFYKADSYNYHTKQHGGLPAAMSFFRSELEYRLRTYIDGLKWRKTADLTGAYTHLADPQTGQIIWSYTITGEGQGPHLEYRNTNYTGFLAVLPALLEKVRAAGFEIQVECSPGKPLPLKYMSHVPLDMIIYEDGVAKYPRARPSTTTYSSTY